MDKDAIETTQDAPGPTPLLRLISREAEQLIGFLTEVERSLAKCAVVDSLRAPHLQFGYDLRLDAFRVPRKVIPYDEELANKAAKEFDRLRSFKPPLPHEDDKGQKRDIKGERQFLRHKTPINSTPQPLRHVLRPRRSQPLRHVVITGNPGSGKSETIKFEARIIACASRMALANARLLPEEAVLPLYMKCASLADVLAKPETLDGTIALFGPIPRPASVSEDDWLTVMRTATAIVKAAESSYATVRPSPGSSISPMGRALWRALTCTDGHNALAFIALDGWDETSDGQRRRLKEYLRPYAGTVSARIYLASRLLHWKSAENPLFDTVAARSGSERDLTLCDFDPSDVKKFIGKFFGSQRIKKKPGDIPLVQRRATGNIPPAQRRLMGDQLIKELATAHHLTEVTPNALMAAFLCNIYWIDRIKGESGLPASRGALIERMLEEMLGKWRFLRTGALVPGESEDPEEKSLWSGPKSKYLSMLGLLSAIAEYTFPDDMILDYVLDDFLYREAEKREHQGYIRRLDSENPLRHYHGNRTKNPKTRGPLVEEFCDDGILVKVRGQNGDGFGFPNRQIHEYLVAYAWAQRINPPKDAKGRPLHEDGWAKMRDELDAWSWHPDYREPVGFLGGLLDDPGPLLDLLADKERDDELHSRTLLAASCLLEIRKDKRKDLEAKIAEVAETMVAGALEEARHVGGIPHHHRPGLAAAAIAGARLNDRPLLEALAIRIGRKDEEALRMTGWIGPAAATPEILAALPRLLEDKGEHVRSAAVAAGGIGAAAAKPEILAALLRLLGDEHEDVRLAAANAVGRIGATAATPEILAALERMLGDEDEDVRFALVGTARVSGALAATPDILAALPRLLGDEDGRVRSAAAHAMGGIGAAAATPEILAALPRLLGDEDGRVRSAAAEAVGGIGAAAATPLILAALLRLLEDGDEDVRFAAAYAVGVIGVDAATPLILATLLRLLEDGDEDVRFAAAYAVGVIGVDAATPEILAALKRMLGDTDGRVRSAAALAIGAIGAAAATPETFTALLRLLGDEDGRVRSAAAEALGWIGTAAATPEILAVLPRLLKDGEENVRSAAAVSVGRMGAGVATPEILAALERMLGDEDEGVRYAAAHALGRLGAVPLLDGVPDDVIWLGATHWPHLRIFRRGGRLVTTPLSKLKAPRLIGVHPDMRALKPPARKKH